MMWPAMAAAAQAAACAVAHTFAAVIFQVRRGGRTDMALMKSVKKWIS
jgi:hypothetical protein